MSPAWRRWAGGDPRTLIEYVQRGHRGDSARGAPADLLGTGMPAPGEGPRAARARARALYEAFASLRIQYADEPTTSDPGRQTIRPPDQVLGRPRHGTCLDLAVTFAGACLDAGLHPLIIVLAGARAGDPAHALVAVWLDGNWSNRAHRDYRWDEQDPDWQTLPPDFIDQLAETEDSPGAFLAVDITGVASRVDSADPRRREQQSWDRSVAHGAALLREASEDRWSVTVDVGLGYEHCEPHPLPYRPSTDVLAAPYLPVPEPVGEPVGESTGDPEGESTGDPEGEPAGEPLGDGTGSNRPLPSLWARHDAIRFHPRDELDFLQDWFQAPDPRGPRTRIVLLHGVGGAGKTRLAAELAHRLATTGWYAGFLVREPDSQDRAWLGDVASPLLVVVDYAEDRKSADVINVLRTLRHREAPTCLLLTARTISSWWDEEIAVALKEDGHPYELHDSALAARHPRHTGVYRAALRSFGGSEATAMGSSPPPDPASGRWTTLDLVMLAWLAARADGTEGVPGSADELYEKVLDHELGYWVRAYKTQIGKPSKRTRQVLREAGACLSLLAPREDRLDHTLKSIDELGNDAGRRDEIAALLTDLLPAAPEDGTLAVRPDPLGTHLAARVFGADRVLLEGCLKQADLDERLNACVSISRFAASSGEESSAAGIAQAALAAAPDLWRPALSVAAAQGGIFLGALERLAAAEDSPLPLAGLAASVPAGHSTLRNLALIATRHSEPDGADATSEEARAARASWLNNLSVRLSEMGEREDARRAISEAVDLYRALAEADPAAFLPHLAMFLSNQSNRLSDTGERAAALASVTEAVELYRTLAESDSIGFLPNLATSLNNLSNRLAESGDRQGALTSITEAVEIRRALVEVERAAYLPDLAASLNNLSNQQGDTGDREAALVSINEAVTLYRTLAEADPAAFLPNLASSLNNLANQQSEVGDRAAALQSIIEAVEIRRALVGTNRAAFLPDLAGSLSNLSVQQSDVGRRGEALASSSESVDLYRDLAQTNPAVFSAGLAGALNNLSNRLSDSGDRARALASITEAVDLYRDLARANPAAFLPDLAMVLNNLSNQQGDMGDCEAALASITEAVEIRRPLARANPGAFLPDLAGSLSNLSNWLSDSGDREGALASITEAVAFYRALARAKPAAFLPDLAMVLNNLSNRQGEMGVREAALTSVIEAVEIRRSLVRTNRAAFLPDLAGSLSNLSGRLSAVGDREAALAAATEAADVFRSLARTDSAAFLPHLATALNNLSVQQGDAGSLDAALASIIEAVEIRRTLAEANPAAFLDGLAGSLNNLSVQQSEVGDSDAALASITEAVALYRTLAEANPAGLLPDLASALSNHSNRLSAVGDHEAALASVNEAVEIRRGLARANPDAFLPDLPGTLNNLSGRLSALGDRAAALAAISEAVSLYRTLARTSPGAFLPDLAKALSNLSAQQHEATDHEAALASITEAVEIRRGLARTNPAAFLSDLAFSLNDLFHQQDGHQRLAEARHTSDQVISEFPSGPQAELLASRAGWFHLHDDHAGATADLLAAARCADATSEPAWAGRSRRAVRGVVEELGLSEPARPYLESVLTDLPAWANTALPPETIERFDQWLSARSWSDRDTFLRETYPLLSTPEEQAALAAARMLYPEASGLDALADFLDAAREHGLAQVLDALGESSSRARLVDQWLATPTWPEDLEFLLSHQQLTEDPLVRDVLAARARSDDPTSLQHLGILDLLGRLPATDVYDAIIDPSTAVDTAMAFVGEGRPDELVPLFLAAPVLTETPFVTAYLFAVRAVFAPATADEDAPTPTDLIAEAAEQGSEVQRGAGAARLRRLAQHRPEHATELLRLASALTASEPAPSAGTSSGMG
ncbi:tetratricopeptide repeat protein [Streptomyces sp. KL118A]|uniref:tetratricopeptide repeat protein n=1 Tax=Streptomyces sp. KL118A TaxID=3045153 RepID=UPI00278BDBF0|nr:tetratricopeptide repeat protein [Streptomyces sp. KL118A]